MFVSRLSFHTVPGRTSEVEEGLKELARIVSEHGGSRPRVLRTHLASLGAADVVFEQEFEELPALEAQIQQVTASNEFQRWSQQISGLLRESPKREVYLVVEG